MGPGVMLPPSYQTTKNDELHDVTDWFHSRLLKNIGRVAMLASASK
jgi:hypothetical protein